jgi:hypothetical protein
LKNGNEFFFSLAGKVQGSFAALELGKGTAVWELSFVL